MCVKSSMTWTGDAVECIPGASPHPEHLRLVPLRGPVLLVQPVEWRPLRLHDERLDVAASVAEPTELSSKRATSDD